jgi:ERCC4-type nuclease
VLNTPYRQGDIITTMTINAVMIDSREPEWIRALTFGNVPTAVTMLEVGDVWITTHDALLIIERKTPSDLLASIADSRLFNQAAGMVKASPWSYVVVTGQITPAAGGRVSLNGIPSNWNYNSIQGALLTVQELGVKVIWLTHEPDFADCLNRLANRSRQPVPVMPARSSAQLGSDIQILSSLPGIGLERALEISKHFDNTAWALSYLTDPSWRGTNITGIGDRIKNGVRNALGLKEKEVLTIDVRLD